MRPPDIHAVKRTENLATFFKCRAPYPVWCFCAKNSTPRSSETFFLETPENECWLEDGDRFLLLVPDELYLDRLLECERILNASLEMAWNLADEMDREA